MNRRTFLAASVAAPITAAAFERKAEPEAMSLGLMIAPGRDPAQSIQKVKSLGLSTCFLSLDQYIGDFKQGYADQLHSALEANGVTPTAAEVVGPGKLVWDFLEGPTTIGLVPPATRQARIDALKQASDFAKKLGIRCIQTHCGFIPENPGDALYEPTVRAIRELAQHCAGNGQDFLMETGQETPTTMSRVIHDVNSSNLGAGLDTANLILYGKANPVDALEILGPHVKSVHAKDGKWPTDPMKLGEEVRIGTGYVDFPRVIAKLHQLGYSGAITIERETSGPGQMADVKKEIAYLRPLIARVQQGS